MKSRPHRVEGYWWILPADRESVDFSSVEKYAEDNNFRPKEELHITIIGSMARDAIVEAMDKLDNGEKKKLLDSIEALINKYDWYFQVTGFYHIKRVHEEVEKEAIICTIDLPDISSFYNDLSKLLGTNLPVQFPHISLFTKGPKNKDGYYGIPLPSEEIFNESIFKRIKEQNGKWTVG